MNDPRADAVPADPSRRCFVQGLAARGSVIMRIEKHAG